MPLMDQGSEFIYPNPKPYLQLSSHVQKELFQCGAQAEAHQGLPPATLITTSTVALGFPHKI